VVQMENGRGFEVLSCPNWKKMQKEIGLEFKSNGYW